jgi:hypothetical protein
MVCVLVDSRASESRYGVRVLVLALLAKQELVKTPLGKQDLVKTLTEALMKLGVDGRTVDGGDFIFDEEGRVTGWRR